MATLQIDEDGFPIPQKLLTAKKISSDSPKTPPAKYWSDTLLPLMKPLATKVVKKKPDNVSAYLSKLIEEILEDRRKSKRRRASRRTRRASNRPMPLGSNSTASTPSFVRDSSLLQNLSESSEEEKPEEVSEIYCFRFRLQNCRRTQSVQIRPNRKMRKMMMKVIHSTNESAWENEFLFDIGSSEDGKRKLMLLIARALGFKWSVFPAFKLTLHVTEKVQRWDSLDFLATFLDSPKEVSDLVKDNPIVCLVDDLEGPESAKVKILLTPNAKDLNFIDGINDDSDLESDEDGSKSAK